MLTEKQLLTSRRALRKYALTLANMGWEDLVQDTLCRGWQKRHLFIEGDATAWLMTIMHNQYINNVRKAVRESGSASQEEQIVPEAQSSHMLALEVSDALRQLPKKQHQLLTIVAIMGDEYEDAAKRLHIPVGTVRSRIARAREKLRRKFA